MSCRVDLIADCTDVAGIGRALFIGDKNDESWLNHASVSLSSCGSLLCIAYKTRLCLLTSQWISATESNTYIISWNGNLSSEVSCVLALPMHSSSLSSENSADWICVVVGFKNGDISFYTNTGHLLLSEKLDNKPVLSMSCNTGCYGNEPDDVHVHFQSAVCVIAGSSLFHTLRYAKMQLARVEAGVINAFSLDGKNIVLRKWQYSEQDVINDAAVVGLELKNTFDHLLAASSYGGYDTWYRSVPPHNTLIVGAGARPYIGFHYALEGGTTPPLQDVAKAVASKIISALPGWLGRSAQKTANPPESKIKEEALSMRSGLGDVQRSANSVVLSPDKKLAAVTDSLGRVAILNVQKGCLIRLFKGYRDSQCAFIQVFEQENKRGPTLSNVKDTKKATFLIIYNSKKGLIDIRLMQRGSRIATFTAAKNGKLIYNTNGLVGSEANYTQKKLNIPVLQCVLLDPDGKIKKIVIPFHHALEGENSERSKDLHLIMELKTLIKQKSPQKEDLVSEVLKTAKELKLPDLKRYFLELIIGKPDIPPVAVLSCINIIKDKFTDNNEMSQQDLKLKHFCENLELVVLFFLRITCREFMVAEDYSNSIQGDTNEQTKTELSDTDNPERGNPDVFEIPESDAIIIKRLTELAKEIVLSDVSSSKVTFADNTRSVFKEFITAFKLDAVSEYIELKETISHSHIQTLAAFTYKSIFTEKYPTSSDFKIIISSSNIDPMVFVKFLVYYCLDMRLNEINIAVIKQFVEILYDIVQTSQEAKQIMYNEISQWWQNIRDLLLEMSCPLRTIIIAMVSRVVSQMIELHSDVEKIDEAWVSLTAENTKWSILIGKLDDIATLSIILQFKGAFKGRSLPKLKDIELEINLKYIYDHGKGSVSELIAKWLCSKGIIPEAIWANEVMEIEKKTEKLKGNVENISSSEEESGYIITNSYRVCVEENSIIFKWLNVLRNQFPFSASADNLIANMCWEYATAWQKEPTDTTNLEAVISCLNNITNAHLCLGLCILVWTTYLKNVFESTCRLINRLGKVPKEQLYFQESGLKDAKVFTKLTYEFLERFQFCTTKAVETEKPILQFEKIWDDNIPALVEICQKTDNIDHNVLNTINQICCVVYYQCNFNIKFSKPLNNLFEIDMQHVFSGVLMNEDTNVRNIHRPEGKVRSNRTKFLSKVIAAALDLITCEDGMDGRMVYRFTESWSWIDKIHVLAELWEVDDDFVTREQIVGLFKLGYDILAESLLTSLKKPHLLLEPLVITCAHRIKRYLEISDQVAEIIAALPPQLMSYIQDVESDSTVSASTTVMSTASILSRVICLVENSPVGNKRYLRLAEVMVYGCEIMQELNVDEERK